MKNNKKSKNLNKILIATYFGWMFDGLDSSIYPLVASQALGDILKNTNLDFHITAAKIGAAFLVGWGLGGYLFGFLGDKIGRAKTLSISVLFYAVFCGLSSLASTWEQLAILRFLTGLGIGGEWALGVALLAESVESKKRIISSAIMATGYPSGYFIAVLANYFISPFGWRWLFLFGVIPAVLVFYIRKNISEPELWTQIEKKVVNPFEIFQKAYLKNLSVAFFLGLTFSFGAWCCVLLWMPLWVEKVLGESIEGKTTVMITFMAAHIIGCYIAGPLLERYSRRRILFFAYFFSFVSASLMYSMFSNLNIVVLLFVFLFGISFGVIPSSFAIYFPELFPTKIRSTAKGFCFNTGRLITAVGVLYSGVLAKTFGGNIGYSAAIMSAVFLVGAIISIFSPKTEIRELMH